MTRRRGRGARADQRSQAQEREALERRWSRTLEHVPDLEALVTAGGRRSEPFHRWIPFRQGFSPGLVTRFLERADLSPGPVIDPFSGSGTTPIACARRGDAALGVEVQASLAFLSGTAFFRGPVPDLPEGLDGAAPSLASQLDHPVHRAALLSAVAGRLQPDGTAPRGALRDLGPALRERLSILRKDLERPPAAAGLILQGDARRLPIRSGCAGGILTSPPYIARFDYERVTRPLERVFRAFCASGKPSGVSQAPDGGPQVRAHRTGRGRPGKPRASQSSTEAHPAVQEACAALERSHQGKAAGLCSAYFADMDQALREMVRVLAPGAPLWLVVGGTLLYDVYVPSDLILAERLEESGLVIERLDVARDLAHSSGRRLGDLPRVKPREALICARKPTR